MAQQEEAFQYLPASLAQRLQCAGIGVRKSMAGSRQSQHRSNTLGSSVEFAEYREYRHGDPIKRIDWSVYARTDRYMIRETHKEVSARCFVLLDLTRSMDYQGEGPMTKLDYGKYLAAGMMFAMINQGDSASLMTFDDDIRESFPSTTTAAGLKPALQHLEIAEARQSGDIAHCFHRVAELLTRRSFIVIISDFLQDNAETLKGLHHLYHEEMDVTIFHVMDPREVTLSMRGVTELRDMETGEKMMFDIDEVRDMYVEQANRHIEHIQRSCTNMQMDYFFSDTTTPAHELILRRSF